MNDTVLVDKAEENGLKFSKKEGTTEAEASSAAPAEEVSAEI